MREIKEEVFIVGHRNPDTDSICSAIAYAYLKNKKENTDKFIPRKAGQLNEETQYVINRFEAVEPEIIDNIKTQIKDIEIRKTHGVLENKSLKNAWALMKELDVFTLPIVRDNKLTGIITTADIAKSYMEVYDSEILSAANTQYLNIINTLEGKIVTGDSEKYFDSGKVLIAAANPEVMENYIEKGDLVILGNRYESQLCAIEMGAKCIIVCEGAEVSTTIKKIAEQNGCTIIGSPHDTYTVARLINQSMPISYFMSREGIVTFSLEDLVEDVKIIMGKTRFRDFPVVDSNNNYIGMVSRRNLINARKKKIILIDHNEKSQAPEGIDEAEILEIIDHHRIGSIETINPVYFRNQPVGCTATMVYQMYRENGIEIPKQIAGLLCAAIISDTLMYTSPTCTQYDVDAAKDLEKIAGINDREFASEMFRAGSNIADKTPEEIFYQDFKKFTLNGVSVGVGQINSINISDLIKIREKVSGYLEQAQKENDVEIIYFMLTSILDQTTNLLYFGKDARKIAEDSFGVQGREDSIILKNVVSRKKQLIPAIMGEIQK